MQNEIILLVSVVVLFSLVVLFYKLFGKAGLYAWTVIATITANIEVLIMIDAFGMQQTLGNILFASTFLVTDILSEMEGKKQANKAVILGIAVSVVFLLITQSWFYYIPNEQDWISPAIREVFRNTPRLMITGVVVYAVVQLFDVWMYHKIWEFTARKSKDKKKWMWIRNNVATMISQLFNTILFTIGAFWGIYSIKTLINIVISSYIIFIFTSLLDTPALYAARHFCKQKENV